MKPWTALGTAWFKECQVVTRPGPLPLLALTEPSMRRCVSRCGVDTAVRNVVRPQLLDFVLRDRFRWVPGSAAGGGAVPRMTRSRVLEGCYRAP